MANISYTNYEDLLAKCQVMAAFANGKTIECKEKTDSEYIPCSTPIWDWDTFDYRIAKISIPYNFKHFMYALEYKKHAIVKNISSGRHYTISSFTNDHIRLESGLYDFDYMFNNYVWYDGETFGYIEN